VKEGESDLNRSLDHLEFSRFNKLNTT